MKAGALRCSGSPLFLKQRFGVGYNFTVVLEVDESDDAEGLPSSVDSSIETKAHDLLIFTRTFVQSAQIQRIGGKEVTIRLPTEEEGSFPQLFDELQLQRTSLSIGAFGVENASLEEVFIDLADGGDHEESSGVETEDEMPPLHNSASTTFFTQIGLGYWKRFVIQRRDLRGLFFSVVVPVLLVALVLLILTINVPVVGPAIELSPSLYKSSNVGTAALTDIVVGGGASSGAKGDLDSRYETLRNWSVSDYENLNFDRRREVNSSQALSHFLLDSINLRDHHERFGSYSLYDNVSMEINVDWAAMESGTESILSLLDDAIGSNQQLESSFSVKPVEVLDLLELVNASFSLLVPVNETNLALELIFDGANFTRAQFEDEVEMILQSVSGESINETAFIAELSGVILDSIVVSGLNVTSLGAWLVGNQTLNEFLEQIGFNLDDASGLNGTVDEWRFGRVIADVSTSLDVASFDSLNLTLAIEALDGSGYWFNERSIANGMGNIASAFIAANSDSGTSTISNDVSSFLSEGAQDGPISESSAILVVWLMTQLVSDSTQDSDALELTFAPRDILKTLGVELDEEIPIVLESSSVSFHPSESIVSFSDLIVTLGSLEFESDVVNVSLSPSSFSESAPTGEETYTFDVQAESSILHNSSSPHAVATFNQHYADFVFKSCIGKTSARLVSENHPLPLTTQQSLEIKTILSVLASMFILIPYCFIPGAFIVFLVREKASKSKHLQLVSGTNITAYWMSAYFYDVSRFFLLTVLVMAVFLMYGKDAAQVFVGTWEAFGCTALLTFGYGLSVLPFAYLLARRFDNHSSAQIAVIGVIFISGFVAVNAYYIMDSIEKTRSIAQTLRPLFRLWPAYNVGDGLIAMSRAFWEREVLFQENSPLDWDVAGKPLGLLYGLAIPYFLMLLFVEFSHEGGAGGIGRLLRRLNEGFENIALKCSGVKVEENGGIALDDGLADNPIGKDSDVLAEEAFVREEFETLKKSAPVLFHELWKVYLPSIGLFGAFMSSTKHFVRRLLCCGRRGKSDVQERRAVQPKRAVRGVSTAVQEGEIYALLGANGAGKTTTLGMLTGDVSPTSGNIYVAGHDATGRLELDGMTRARKHIGFCPQVDPLLDQMSVRETLTLFGRLRGFGCDTIDNVVGRIMERLLLIPHASKTCESLSGGNKRKLSLGIALIGGPTVLLIDESSSGLDPLAKRRMWNLISSVAKNKTVLLTTHSMEEAEALCTRAGIMAKGQLLCLGSVQHLKTKYLDGYTIDVFCLANSSDTQVEELVTEILTIALPGTSLSERHGRWCRFDLTNASEIGLGTTFKNLEDLKNNESVLESYSISQCSLEQVFVQLSNKERDDAATNSSIATTPAEQSHDVSVENLSSSGSNV
uniref:ABC transporter domain-containing protein n=1 Tax=Entomoneis paludosa TaxID=265537 RepID=A0A7S3DQC5_9STRA